MKCIEILFLPVNSTAVTQPLDQGIIRAVKALFNGKKLRDILEKIEQGQDTFEAYKNLTIKDAIIMLKLAWNDIKKDTIVNCFKHAKWIDNSNLEDLPNVYSIEHFDQFCNLPSILDPINEFEKIEFNEKDTVLEEYNQLISSDTNTLPEKVTEEVEHEEAMFLPTVNVSDCLMSLQHLKSFFLSDQNFDIEAIAAVDKLSKCLIEKKNTGPLDNWIKINVSKNKICLI